MKRKVLFVCIHNSARSQMAEAFLNKICGQYFEAQSAGLEPGKLNANVVAAMGEIGIDLSSRATKSVFDILQTGQTFSYVITVCDEGAAERCPVFPGVSTRLHWSFPDPSAFRGHPEAIMARTRDVRDAIQRKVELWCSEVCSSVST
jgi:arsenate reductase